MTNTHTHTHPRTQHTHSTHTHTPPTPSHPLRLSYSTRFELPASYCKFPLAIYFTYGHIYVSGGSGGKASARNMGDPGRSLGREDPLEEEMATPSSTLA